MKLELLGRLTLSYLNQGLLICRFIFILSFLTTFSYGQVVIKGKIQNYDGESTIAFYPTLDGIFAPIWRTIKPKSNGTFEIRYSNGGFGTTALYFKKLGFRFFHKSDSKIYIEIDQEKIDQIEKLNWETEYYLDRVKQKALISIDGDYSEINRFYNRNIRSSYSSTTSLDSDYYSGLIYLTKTPDQALILLDSLMQMELTQIDNLNIDVSKEINDSDSEEDVKRFLINEVKAFYSSTFLHGLELKRLQQKRELLNDSKSELTLYNQEWERLTEKVLTYSLNEVMPITQSKDYLEYLKNVVNNLEGQYKLDYTKRLKLPDEYVHQNLIDIDSTKTTVLDSISIFTLKLLNLKIYLESQLFYSPVLLNAIDDLKKTNPKSSHLTYYQPQIDKLENYVNDNSKNFSDAKILNTNYTTLDYLLERFAGQNMFIDIWATWCMPCIKEFQHKSILEGYSNNKDLVLIYISIDKPHWENRWKENINYNQLKGYHLRANNELIEDIWNKIGGQKGQIPRYLLINKNGEIINNDAPAPSSNSELKEEIEKMLEL